MEFLNSDDEKLAAIKRISTAIMNGLNKTLDLSDPSQSMPAYFALILSAGSMLGLFGSDQEIQIMIDQTADLLRKAALVTKKLAEDS